MRGVFAAVHRTVSLVPHEGSHCSSNAHWSAGLPNRVKSDRSCIISRMQPADEGLLVRERDLKMMLEEILDRPTEEVCGLLAGVGNLVERVIPVENELHSPVRYRMEARAQVQAMQAIEDARQMLVGIYHSHPLGPSGLSGQDLQQAAYPEAAYLVWSFSGLEWKCRAFRLEEGRAREVPIVQMQGAMSAEESQKPSHG
jgi:proteasome lid subunit RPN8/RPN11